MEALLRHRHFVWILAFAALLLTGAFQGSRGLYGSTETRYAECARQTLASGDLLTPVLNGKPHWTKPPMTYIAIGAGLKLFGINNWGARAYLIPVFILTVLALYVAGREMWNERAGRLAGLLYLTGPFTMASSSVVSTDALMTMWCATAIMFFILALNRSRPIFIVGMWAMLGLAFFTKGPPALLIPLSGAIPAWWVARKRGLRVALWDWRGLLLFAMVALWWYLYQAARTPGLLSYWIEKELVERNVSDEFERNPEFTWALKTYLPILLFGLAPMSFIVYRFLPRLPWLSKDVRWRPSQWPQGERWAFVVFGFLIPMIVFFASTSKLPLYVLPMFIPMALAVAWALDWLLEQKLITTRPLGWCAIVCMLGFVGYKAITPHIPEEKDAEYLTRHLAPVMEQYAPYQLYVVRSTPYYGIQFYLQCEFPTTSLEAIKDQFRTEAGSEPTPLFLVREKEVGKNKLPRKVDLDRYPPQVITPDWVLLAGDKPVLMSIE